MAENTENSGCLQRDSAEHEGYAKARRSFNLIWKERDSAQPKLLEAILYKDNFNRAYKRVKSNKGAPGVDGMTIEEALPYLQEHQQELTARIYRGKYTPSPVRRVEIPKLDGGVRKLGIPTVIDRTLQQAVTQQLVPIYEPLFADGSYGYRPNRDAKGAILKVKEYAELGYTYAVVLDLSKYFDTINHEILINLLRKNVLGRLLESSTRYIEEKLKLTVNREKSRTVSVFAIRNFKFLGFALGRNKSGIYVRVHAKSWEKFKSKLKELSSRKRCQSIKPSLERIKVYARGWLNYYGIASMKSNMNDVNGWRYHRIRTCIWKQWKRVRTRYRNLRVMGVPKDLAWKAANSRRGYWFTTHTVAINMAMTKERLINSGFYDLAAAYQSKLEFKQ